MRMIDFDVTKAVTFFDKDFWVNLGKIVGVVVTFGGSYLMARKNKLIRYPSDRVTQGDFNPIKDQVKELKKNIDDIFSKLNKHGTDIALIKRDVHNLGQKISVLTIEVSNSMIKMDKKIYDYHQQNRTEMTEALRQMVETAQEHNKQIDEKNENNYTRLFNLVTQHISERT